MPLRDHLNKLHYYQAIVESRSLLKAGQKVGITQPQLSRVLKSLEDHLETQLFVRTPSGVETTREGDILFQASNIILEKIAETEKKILFGQQKLSGQIRVGTYDSIARYFFPTFLKYLDSTFPGIELLLETNRSSHILKGIKNGHIDIGVIVGEKKPQMQNITAHPIYQDAFGFYHHPTISKGFLGNLIFFPEAFKADTQSVPSFLKSYKFSRSTLSDNLETVKALAEEGVGVALLPHRVARESVLQGKLVSLKRLSHKKDLFPHSIFLCQRKNQQSDEILSLVSEISRFLVAWSKN